MRSIVAALLLINVAVAILGYLVSSTASTAVSRLTTIENQAAVAVFIVVNLLCGYGLYLDCRARVPLITTAVALFLPALMVFTTIQSLFFA